MAKKNNIYLIIMIIIITIIGIFTLYKINKRHEEKLYDVLYKNIKYQSKQCFLKEECSDEITLNELYEKNYLDIQYDPITKEELDKNIKIVIKDEKIIINK